MPNLQVHRSVTVPRRVAYGVGVLVALPVLALAGAVAFMGVAMGLAVGCLAVLLPLLGLGLWGLWDRVWLGLRLRIVQWEFGLKFPVPVSLLRFQPLHTSVGRQLGRVGAFPWRELRAVLREEPIVLSVEAPSDDTHIQMVLGPRWAVARLASLTIDEPPHSEKSPEVTHGR